MDRWGEIGERAAADAGAEAALLGDFLPRLAEACRAGRPIGARRLAAYRALGARAAEQGVPLRPLLDLYLSAAWRAWPQLPGVADGDADAVRAAGEVVLHATDDAVAAVADGFDAARRGALRMAEADRREFCDDLLTGTGSPTDLAARADRYGLDLGAGHAVLLVAGGRGVRDTDPRLSAVTTAVGGGALVTTRHERLVVILPTTEQAAADTAARTLLSLPDTPRVAVGRPHTGPAGVARSYAEAVDAADLADRVALPGPLLRATDLLVYRVLLRDREAVVDLIDTVLAPLRTARGGAAPLLATLDAYLSGGGNTAATARRLHLSVRAVTYRLARVRELTGYDPDGPADRFTLQAATLAAHALDWS